MTDRTLLESAQPRSAWQTGERATHRWRAIGLAGCAALVVLSTTGCVVAPARPVVVAPAPVYVAPAYPSPGVGWVWVAHPRHGWGWHHRDHGWHRGWR